MKRVPANCGNVKTLTALAQLVKLYIETHGASIADLIEITGYSRRAVLAAKKEIRGALGCTPSHTGVHRAALGGAPGCTGGASRFTLLGVKPAALAEKVLDSRQENPPHTPPVYHNSSAAELAPTSKLDDGPERVAGPPEQNSTIQYSTSLEAGNSLRWNKIRLIDGLAELLKGDSLQERKQHAAGHLLILLETYDCETVGKALTRLKTRIQDGDEIRSYTKMLGLLCDDVSRDGKRGSPKRTIPIGAIDLGDGEYVSRW